MTTLPLPLIMNTKRISLIGSQNNNNNNSHSLNASMTSQASSVDSLSKRVKKLVGSMENAEDKTPLTIIQTNENSLPQIKVKTNSIKCYTDSDNESFSSATKVSPISSSITISNAFPNFNTNIEPQHEATRAEHEESVIYLGSYNNNSNRIDSLRSTSEQFIEAATAIKSNNNLELKSASLSQLSQQQSLNYFIKDKNRFKSNSSSSSTSAISSVNNQYPHQMTPKLPKDNPTSSNKNKNLIDKLNSDGSGSDSGFIQTSHTQHYLTTVSTKQKQTNEDKTSSTSSIASSTVSSRSIGMYKYQSQLENDLKELPSHLFKQSTSKSFYNNNDFDIESLDRRRATITGRSSNQQTKNIPILDDNFIGSRSSSQSSSDDCDLIPTIKSAIESVNTTLDIYKNRRQQILEKSRLEESRRNSCIPSFLITNNNNKQIENDIISSSSSSSSLKSTSMSTTTFSKNKSANKYNFTTSDEFDSDDLKLREPIVSKAFSGGQNALHSAKTNEIQMNLNSKKSESTTSSKKADDKVIKHFKI
jgi:hypothetical protein